MKRRYTYATVLAAGLLTVLGSAAAVADPTTTTSPPITTPPSPPPTAPPTTPVPPIADAMSISPNSGRPGQTVEITVPERCGAGVQFSSTVLTIGIAHPEASYEEVSATVNSNAKPGSYDVVAICLQGDPPSPHFFAAQFTVLANPTPPPPGNPVIKVPTQVKKVPTGAAQTGGGGTARLS